MFITVIPAIRTIPGVEEFDYAIGRDADVRIGDVLRVPFRKRLIPALVSAKSPDSAYADKAVLLEDPRPLLRLGKTAPKILTLSAMRTFVSKPSICAAWIRTVPKRAVPLPADFEPTPIQCGMPERVTRHLVRRWHDPQGLLASARGRTGRTLILTPWQHRADLLSQELDCAVLHADLADGTAWTAMRTFCETPKTTLVATRIGAWLSCLADTVIIDEPENDDFKQDELSPRIDARWLVDSCVSIRPDLSVLAFGTTPRLTSDPASWNDAPEIDLQLETEPRQRRGASDIEGVSARVMDEIGLALDTRTPVTVIHAVSGDRARVVCRDCGWAATCEACTHPLASVGRGQGICRHCGHRQAIPESCPSCNGTDLARSSIGKDRLADQLRTRFASDLLRVITPAELQTTSLPRSGLVILTDAALLGGVTEDTRRRERLLISWRRLAAVFASSGSRVIAQGTDEMLADCRKWLTSTGVSETWKTELGERRMFGYPPAHRLIKLLIDGTEAEAVSVMTDLEKTIQQDWHINGPYPVPYRSVTRKPRWILQFLAPTIAGDGQLFAILNPLKSRAIIDLDPIAFFA